MPTANTNLFNGMVRHQIGLIRYSTSTVKEIIALLNRSQERVLSEISKFDVSDGTGSFSQARLDALLASVRAIDVEAGKVMSGAIDESMQHLIDYESDFVQRFLGKVLPPELPVQFNIASPTAESLYAAVHARPFEGAILKEYYASLPEVIMKPVRETLRQGFTNGRTTDQIIRELRGTRAAKYTDGILQQPRRSVERMVRTAINHTATTAREEIYKNNEDLIKGVRWVSTLDMRTSDICQALDGQVFDPGEGPRPPAHFNCRSTTTPILKSWKELGLNIDELPPGSRASMDGQVSATETYQTWLSKQPASVQDEVLGPTRAALFRDGGLTLDRFVDDAGNSLTLDQLREREASAFDAIRNAVSDPFASIPEADKLNLIPLGGGVVGVNKSYSFIHDGEKFFAKEVRDNREIAAMEVMQVFGNRVLSATTRGNLFITSWVDAPVLAKASTEKVKEAIAAMSLAERDTKWLSEFVIGDTDRHSGNYLVFDGKIISIDFGVAFSSNQFQRPSRFLDSSNAYFQTLFHDAIERKWDMGAKISREAVESIISKKDEVLALLEARKIEDSDPSIGANENEVLAKFKILEKLAKTKGDLKLSDFFKAVGYTPRND